MKKNIASLLMFSTLWILIISMVPIGCEDEELKSIDEITFTFNRFTVKNDSVTWYYYIDDSLCGAKFLESNLFEADSVGFTTNKMVRIGEAYYVLDFIIDSKYIFYQRRETYKGFHNNSGACNNEDFNMKLNVKEKFDLGDTLWLKEK